MTAPRAKARKMWLTRYEKNEAYSDINVMVFPRKVKREPWDVRPPQELVYVIDAAQVEQIVEQMAEAQNTYDAKKRVKEWTYRDSAKAALRAIGIK